MRSGPGPSESALVDQTRGDRVRQAVLGHESARSADRVPRADSPGSALFPALGPSGLLNGRPESVVSGPLGGIRGHESSPTPLPPSLLSRLAQPHSVHSCWVTPVSASTSPRIPQEPPHPRCSGGGWQVLSPAVGVVSPAALQRSSELVWLSTNQGGGASGPGSGYLSVDLPRGGRSGSPPPWRGRHRSGDRPTSPPACGSTTCSTRSQGSRSVTDQPDNRLERLWIRHHRAVGDILSIHHLGDGNLHHLVAPSPR